MLEFTLIPQSNIVASKDTRFPWYSANIDPQFLLVGNQDLGGLKIRISFELTVYGKMISSPKLYWDTGAGFSENLSVGLRISNDGKVDQEISLPKEIHSLRLDPIAQEGLFTLNFFKIEILGPSDGDVQNLTINGTRNYLQWIKFYEPKSSSYPDFRQRSSSWQKQPLVSILMPTYNSPETWLRKAIDSVLGQVYENWELCIADDASTIPNVRVVLDEYSSKDHRIKIIYRDKNEHISAASNSALSLATGEYVGFLDHDDELHPLALYGVVKAINTNPRAMLVYTDEDKIDEAGNRNDPYFKCDFNYDLLLSQNMICHFGVYRTDVALQIGGFRLGYEGSQDYDFTLRFIDHIGKKGIVHVPHVLYHWRQHPMSTSQTHENKPYAYTAAEKSIEDHLERVGARANVEPAPGAPSYHWVRYSLPEPVPSVEIIIPTRDGADFLERCVRSILEKTEYSNYTVTIIDNGSVKQETFELFSVLLQDSRVQISRDDSPFNFSAINNRVAMKSSSKYVCLMNNDIEVISPNWLSEMVSIAVQPGVGAVGPRLWYSNFTLQHGGVVLGVGGFAGHSHKYLPQYNPGYFSRAVIRSNFSAVTGACLLISVQTYRSVGGLDEELTVALNDVDFCIRVREAGYRNVWTPFAELFHYESATRGYENDPQKLARLNREIERIKTRYGSLLEEDPCYSPNLTLETEDFSMAWPPRTFLD